MFFRKHFNTNFFEMGEVLSWESATMLELEQKVEEAGITKTSVGLDLHVVAAPNELSLRETDSMALHDLFR
jgi:hypothetical protein